MTDFERKVLRALAQGASIEGHGMVAWVAAARRLEKRGLLTKGRRWYLTDSGKQSLSEEPKAPS